MLRVLPRTSLRLFASVCLALTCDWAAAVGLQVSPTDLKLKATQNADGLTLSNTGDAVIHAQVRVYHWAQDQGGDQLTASRGLVVSPPMLEIKPGDQQLIRVIRVGAPPSGASAVEDTYRLAIDELPVDAPGGPGLHFVVHYSLPIFIEPAGMTDVVPELQWSLRKKGKQVVLEVSNHGSGHAQLSALNFIDAAGNRTEVEAGLLGYVLPNATMHWTLKPPSAAFGTGGTLEMMVNGQKTTQNLSLADRSP
jgi:fimbrial chaperone protein